MKSNIVEFPYVRPEYEKRDLLPWVEAFGTKRSRNGKTIATYHVRCLKCLRIRLMSDFHVRVCDDCKDEK